MFPSEDKTYKLNHLIEIEIDNAMNQNRHMNAKIIKTIFEATKQKFYGTGNEQKNSKTQRQ